MKPQIHNDEATIELIHIVTDTSIPYDPEHIQKSVRRGANINNISRDGYSVLMRALGRTPDANTNNIIRDLVVNGADINFSSENFSVLSLASIKFGKEILNLLINDSTAQNILDKGLIQAATNDNIVAIQYLLDAGASHNLTINDGEKEEPLLLFILQYEDEDKNIDSIIKSIIDKTVFTNSPHIIDKALKYELENNQSNYVKELLNREKFIPPQLLNFIKENNLEKAPMTLAVEIATRDENIEISPTELSGITVEAYISTKSSLLNSAEELKQFRDTYLKDGGVILNKMSKDTQLFLKTIFDLDYITLDPKQTQEEDKLREIKINLPNHDSFRDNISAQNTAIFEIIKSGNLQSSLNKESLSYLNQRLTNIETYGTSLETLSKQQRTDLTTILYPYLTNSGHEETRLGTPASTTDSHETDFIKLRPSASCQLASKESISSNLDCDCDIEDKQSTRY